MKAFMKVLYIITMTILVMALGMTQLVSAIPFTDSGEINYSEAVDVLTGIGIIEGFPDGSFRPINNVTRAQAATILARLLLGTNAADALSDGPTGFSDVDGVSGAGFAVKYISYCVSEGIVVGFPDATFHPNDPVTATQFAVMLMRALDIGDPDNYIGPEWDVYAIFFGMENGILDTGVNYKLPANREQTAKYAFNGLLHSPGGQTGAVAQDSLAAKVYPSLKKSNEGLDSLGKPGIIWTYGDPAVVIHSNVITGAAAAQIALVIGFDSKNASSGGQTSTTYTARIVDTKGVASTVPTTAAIFNESGRDATYRGVVCSYTVGPDGLYTFTAPAESAPGQYLIDTGIWAVANKSTDLRGGNTVKFANEATKFVVVSYSGSGSSYGPNGSVSVYKGKDEIQSFSLLTRTTAVSLKADSGGPDNVADIVFIYDDVYASTQDTYVFVVGSWTQTSDGYGVDTIIKGLDTAIRAKNETERNKLTDLTGLLLKGISVTSSGIVTPGAVWNANWDAQSSIQNNGGLLILDGTTSDLTVADDVPVYTITIPESGPRDAKASTGAAVKLKTALSLAADDFAYIVKRGDAAIAIYIIVDKSALVQKELNFSHIDYNAGDGVTPTAGDAAPKPGDPELPFVTHDAGITVTNPGAWKGLSSGNFPAAGEEATYTVVLAAMAGYTFTGGTGLTPGNFSAPNASVDVINDGYTLTLVFTYTAA